MSDPVPMAEGSIRGPAWTPPGLDIAAGRFPLSVEAHLMSMTGRLVPGATTVTTNARYYSIHGLVAVEAGERDLTEQDTLGLLRCEVVFAAAALLADDAVVSSPHGGERLEEAMSAGVLDVEAMATPGSGYAKSKSGFWGPYMASEITLGILDPADPTRPGPRSNRGALEEGLEGLVDLEGLMLR